MAEEEVRGYIDNVTRRAWVFRVLGSVRNIIEKEIEHGNGDYEVEHTQTTVRDG